MDNKLSDQIDQYLDGTLSAEENAAFEKALAENESFRQQVDLQRNLRQGIERLNLKASISSQFRKMTLKNKIYKWGVATVAVAAIGTAVYFGNSSFNANKTNAENAPLPALNEQGKAEWSDADKNLPLQLFSIDPERDTVIETEGGIVFAVPAGAFLNAKKPLTLEIREALTTSDIIKGGLSTTSDGNLLETGGMFYLNARNGEQSLKINPAKPVYANVPTDEVKPGMQLFEGEREPGGGINWRNPKPLEKDLLPVDIYSLDFYPSGYAAKIAELGFDANNKKVRDSVYYSYAGRHNPVDFSGYVSKNAFGILYEDIAYRNQKQKPNTEYRAADGKALFRANCASCHYPSEKTLTGPGLQGVLGRVPSREWIYNWVHNNVAVRASGDQYGNVKFREFNGSVMTTFPQLKNEEIDAIIAYADRGGVPESDTSSVLEINPARISAIWNDQFQNTLIATKEFEERLKVIFKMGRPEILDLYVHNLDKKMYQVDSMAAAQCEGSYGMQFHNFYLRHDGGVAISAPHMQKLQAYFELKRKAAQEAAEKTFAARKAKENAQDQAYSADQTQKSIESAARDADNFNKEFNINLTEACRQLGIKHTWSNAYYSFPLSGSGWSNVDRYVFAATASRTTLDYTDPYTGRKAVIRYEPLSVNITDFANYEQLSVYLVSDSLPSFMKISGSNGVYAEKLNELMKYSLVVVGQKDGKWSWKNEGEVKPGTVAVQLDAIEESQLRVNLDYAFSKKAGTDFRKELDHMVEQHTYAVQLKQRKAQEEIDEQVMRVIFPFYVKPLPEERHMK